MFLTFITFLIILSLLVFVHELGHFISARKNGVAVEEFGFGFPPRLFGIKKGKTIYSINLIPIGGFVKLKGEGGEKKEDKDSFAHKKIWQRGVILSSGVAMNILLAAVLLSVGFFIGLPQVINSHIDETKAKDIKIQVISVIKNSPAQEAGVEVGDIILSIDNQEFKEIKDIQNYIGQKDKEISIKLRRGDDKLIKQIIPRIINLEEEKLIPPKKRTEKKVIGVALVKTGIISYPWYQAIWNGFKTTVLLTGRIMVAFYKLFKDMIIKREIAAEVAGPVGIAVMTGRVVHLGFIYILQFAAILSLNLAILNFLPFPALDGGRILFLVIEKIRKKPVNEKIERMIHNTGFIILMALAILVTFRDVGKFGGKLIETLKGLIKR